MATEGAADLEHTPLCSKSDTADLVTGRTVRPKTAIALTLIGAAASFFAPVVSGARQPEQLGSAFCASRTVKTDPNAEFKVRLLISGTAVPQGGTVRIRLENLGAVDAAYGYPYRLQRHERKGWVSLPVGPFFSARLTLRSGTAGRCQTIHMARSSAPGVYRVSKSAWPAAEKDERPKAVARATFRVVADSRVDPQRPCCSQARPNSRIIRG
jgi:hypothetical protein